MIDEAMYLIPKIMVEDEIEHHGRVHRHPAPRRIHPKPLQDPHPPLYLACTHNESLQTAGSRGIGALVLGFGGPEEVAKKNEAYRQRVQGPRPADQVGYRPTEHLAALCPAIVLDDNDDGAQHRHPRPALLHGVDRVLVQRRRDARPHRSGPTTTSTVTQTTGDIDHPHEVGVRGHRPRLLRSPR